MLKTTTIKARTTTPKGTSCNLNEARQSAGTLNEGGEEKECRPSQNICEMRVREAGRQGICCIPALRAPIAAVIRRGPSAWFQPYQRREAADQRVLGGTVGGRVGVRPASTFAQFVASTRGGAPLVTAVAPRRRVSTSPRGRCAFRASCKTPRRPAARTASPTTFAVRPRPRRAGAPACTGARP